MNMLFFQDFLLSSSVWFFLLFGYFAPFVVLFMVRGCLYIRRKRAYYRRARIILLANSRRDCLFVSITLTEILERRIIKSGVMPDFEYKRLGLFGRIKENLRSKAKAYFSRIRYIYFFVWAILEPALLFGYWSIVFLTYTISCIIVFKASYELTSVLLIHRWFTLDPRGAETQLNPIFFGTRVFRGPDFIYVLARWTDSDLYTVYDPLSIFFDNLRISFFISHPDLFFGLLSEKTDFRTVPFSFQEVFNSFFTFWSIDYVPSRVKFPVEDIPGLYTELRYRVISSYGVTVLFYLSLSFWITAVLSVVRQLSIISYFASRFSSIKTFDQICPQDSTQFLVETDGTLGFGTVAEDHQAATHDRTKNLFGFKYRDHGRLWYYITFVIRHSYVNLVIFYIYDWALFIFWPLTVIGGAIGSSVALLASGYLDLFTTLTSHMSFRSHAVQFFDYISHVTSRQGCVASLEYFLVFAYGIPLFLVSCLALYVVYFFLPLWLLSTFLLKNTFATLWLSVWQVKHCTDYSHEYVDQYQYLISQSVNLNWATRVCNYLDLLDEAGDMLDDLYLLYYPVTILVFFISWVVLILILLPFVFEPFFTLLIIFYNQRTSSFRPFAEIHGILKAQICLFGLLTQQRMWALIELCRRIIVLFQTGGDFSQIFSLKREKGTPPNVKLTVLPEKSDVLTSISEPSKKKKVTRRELNDEVAEVLDQQMVDQNKRLLDQDPIGNSTEEMDLIDPQPETDPASLEWQVDTPIDPDDWQDGFEDGPMEIPDEWEEGEEAFYEDTAENSDTLEEGECRAAGEYRDFIQSLAYGRHSYRLSVWPDFLYLFNYDETILFHTEAVYQARVLPNVLTHSEALKVFDRIINQDFVKRWEQTTMELESSTDDEFFHHAAVDALHAFARFIILLLLSVLLYIFHHRAVYLALIIHGLASSGFLYDLGAVDVHGVDAAVEGASTMLIEVRSHIFAIIDSSDKVNYGEDFEFWRYWDQEDQDHYNLRVTTTLKQFLTFYETFNGYTVTPVTHSAFYGVVVQYFLPLYTILFVVLLAMLFSTRIRVEIMRQWSLVVSVFFYFFLTYIDIMYGYGRLETMYPYSSPINYYSFFLDSVSTSDWDHIQNQEPLPGGFSVITHEEGFAKLEASLTKQLHYWYKTWGSISDRLERRASEVDAYTGNQIWVWWRDAWQWYFNITEQGWELKGRAFHSFIDHTGSIVKPYHRTLKGYFDHWVVAYQHSFFSDLLKPYIQGTLTDYRYKLVALLDYISAPVLTLEQELIEYLYSYYLDICAYPAFLQGYYIVCLEYIGSMSAFSLIWFELCFAVLLACLHRYWRLSFYLYCRNYTVYQKLRHNRRWYMYIPFGPMFVYHSLIAWLEVKYTIPSRLRLAIRLQRQRYRGILMANLFKIRYFPKLYTLWYTILEPHVNVMRLYPKTKRGYIRMFKNYFVYVRGEYLKHFDFSMFVIVQLDYWNLYFLNRRNYFWYGWLVPSYNILADELHLLRWYFFIKTTPVDKRLGKSRFVPRPYTYHKSCMDFTFRRTRPRFLYPYGYPLLKPLVLKTSYDDINYDNTTYY
jgi:hypothetical protein